MISTNSSLNGRNTMKNVDTINKMFLLIRYTHKAPKYFYKELIFYKKVLYTELFFSIKQNKD